LSEHDGKGDIVKAAREFCWGIQTKQRALKEMEPELLNNLLKGNWQILLRYSSTYLEAR